MIALYPGAFKPPHRGHFNVVKSLLDGSYNGTVYSKDDYKEKASSLFSDKTNEKPKIDKVVIFVGGGERNGIDKEEATHIWEVYAQHLGNVEIVDGQKNPMFAAKDYARENHNELFVAVTGIRGEEDFVDLKRVTTFNNVDNVQGLALASKPGSGVRATDFRKSILAGNLDQIIDFFPEELERDEILNILNDLKDKIVAEILGSNIKGFVEEYFVEDKDIKYTNPNFNNEWEEAIRYPEFKQMGKEKWIEVANKGKAVSYSSIKDKLGNVDLNFDGLEEPKKQRFNAAYEKGVIEMSIAVKFDDNDYDLVAGNTRLSGLVKNGIDPQIWIVDISNLQENLEPRLELKDYITSLTEYMLDNGMGIVPLPEVKLRKDEANAANFFGKTAYYDPNAREIVLYTLGRHDKDIVRSFSHEMVHHMQNLNGTLGNVQTSNTNEDDHLQELEKEAYLTGNITFRNWEDSLK